MVKSLTIAVASLTAGIAIGTFLNASDSPQGGGAHQIGEFPDLGKGLRETPGCIGVKTVAQPGSNQQTIMAWFENKQAVRNWYFSKMHQDAMKKFFPGFGQTDPLSGFKDEKAPILMIASVTPGDKPLPGTKLVAKQISIEAYTPVPGGVALGGTFAPEKLQVPGLKRIPTGNE